MLVLRLSVRSLGDVLIRHPAGHFQRISGIAPLISVCPES